MQMFEPASMGALSVANRLVRSATFEGVCDQDGFPGAAYRDFYRGLAASGIGTLITGFCYVARQGRAIHPGQAGIDADEKIAAFAEVAEAVHQHDCKIIMQLAHTGRQTKSRFTGRPVVGVSTKKSPYFKERPQVLDRRQVLDIVQQFVEAAGRARSAGFDGVQLHAAHGYLIHQFILPSLNDRKDEFKIDGQRQIGTRFLELIIDGIKANCGPEFPLLVKVSAADELRPPFTAHQFKELIGFLDDKPVDAIEVSYGTMDHALNIFRGASIPLETILDHDPVYRRRGRASRFLWKRVAVPLLSRSVRPFEPMYNLPHARTAKAHTAIPVISVGGFRSGDEIARALDSGAADFVSLSRPLIAEPDFVGRLRHDMSYVSRCINCNSCAVMTSSGNPTACYRGHRKTGGRDQ